VVIGEAPKIQDKSEVEYKLYYIVKTIKASKMGCYFQERNGQ